MADTLQAFYEIADPFTGDIRFVNNETKECILILPLDAELYFQLNRSITSTQSEEKWIYLIDSSTSQKCYINSTTKEKVFERPKQGEIISMIAMQVP